MNSVCTKLKPTTFNNILTHKSYFRRFSSEKERQHSLFISEQKRQNESVGRIEKIEIHYEGVPENTTLLMNKNISTPFNCAQHLGEMLVKRSAVALLNNTTLWHMHKPLPESCTLQLLHYHMPQPFAVNKTFWRTCSFLLGAVINDAFKENVQVNLHSFPNANVKSGSFVYDVQLSLDDWHPTQNELKVLSIEMVKFCQQGHKIECLDVSVDLALEMFKNNPFKKEQIPDIAANNGGKVTLYKADKHIDISKGPMVTNTDHLGRITVSNVFKLDTDGLEGPIYRFQGVALPRNIVLNHFAYGLLEDRARKLNTARIPGKSSGVTEDNSFVTQTVAV